MTRWVACARLGCIAADFQRLSGGHVGRECVLRKCTLLYFYIVVDKEECVVVAMCCMGLALKRYISRTQYNIFESLYVLSQKNTYSAWHFPVRIAYVVML